MHRKQNQAKERTGSGAGWPTIVFWAVVGIAAVSVLAMPVGRWVIGILEMLAG